MLGKLIPLLIMIVGVTANADKIKPLLNRATDATTQFEVNALTQRIVTDVVTGGTRPTPDEFAEYVRANMGASEQSKVERDVSRDQYGTPYRVRYPEGAVIVSSAGPDKKFDTSDDVYSKRKF